jgi:hypothetical protein
MRRDLQEGTSIFAELFWKYVADCRRCGGSPAHSPTAKRARAYSPARMHAHACVVRVHASALKRVYLART